ncbi:hypothetical protein G6688_05045 [Polynucleobacter paneuropaeus]|nr:hypothetical protein G6688_05045 [Polynucleobacter paneuropaeus]
MKKYLININISIYEESEDPFPKDSPSQEITPLVANQMLSKYQLHMSSDGNYQKASPSTNHSGAKIIAFPKCKLLGG